MSETSTVNFGFGWDPTLQVGEIKGVTPASTKPTVDVVDEKIAFLEMQQAIMANEPDNLRNLIKIVSLKIGQQRTLCRLTIKHFTPQLAEVLQSFPWNEVVKEEHLLSAVKKDQHAAFTFMLSYLNTYQFKRAYHHLMDVNANNFALYDKYRPAIFARLIPEHQQDVAKSFAVELRAVKPNRVEAYYNLAASLSHMDWKSIFSSPHMYDYTSVDETWGMGWLIKEFPNVQNQYNELAATQTKMIEQVGALIEKIVVPVVESVDLPGVYRTRHSNEFFTENFLQICKKTQFDVDQMCRTMGEMLKLSKSYGIETKDMVLMLIKNQSSTLSNFEEVLKQIYFDNYKTPLPLPWHMLATPLEKILNNHHYTTSVLRLLGSEEGRSALRGYFKNPLYLRKFAYQMVNQKMEGPDLNKVIRNADIFIDEKGNTLMHFVAKSFFEKMDVVKPWVVNPKINWEEKNSCGFSPKEIAYQHFGSFTQTLVDDAENIFNERANNILNKNLKQQILQKSKPTFKRKI